ncbi:MULTISPECIES: hypothetical protein [unclassified Halobacteriovorax]
MKAREVLKKPGVLGGLLFLLGNVTGVAIPPEMIGPLSGWLTGLL